MRMIIFIFLFFFSNFFISETFCKNIKKEVIVIAGFFPSTSMLTKSKFNRIRKARIHNIRKNKKTFNIFSNELQNVLNLKHNTNKKNISMYIYWDIGNRILNSSLYIKLGSSNLINKLSKSLNINSALLKNCLIFYKKYKLLSPNLSWNHYKELIFIKNINKRTFYHNMSVKKSWSSLELSQHINNNFFDKTNNLIIENTINASIKMLQPEIVITKHLNSSLMPLKNSPHDNSLLT